MENKHTSIQKGIERAAKAGLTKPYDIAIMIQVQLRRDGFQIVRLPRKGK